MSLLTLAKARERLWDYGAIGVPFSIATTTQKAQFDFRLNQVCERFMEEGKYKNTLRRVTVDIQEGYITLPREIGTILGIKLQSSTGCCCNSIIYSRFHEFAHCISCCSTGTYPISETSQTFITPTGPFYLRIKSTVSEGKTIKFIGGWDTNDDQLFTTQTLTIINGSATTSIQYNNLPPAGGIQKQVTTVPCELYSVDSLGTETLIAIYGPNEEVPSYKRYRVPDWNSTFTSALLFGKLAFVEAVSDTDIVYPSNFGALKIGLKALQSEDADEDESADRDWQRAYARLNAEVTEAEGDSEYPVFRVSSNFACDGIPNVT